jgi:hypothetical protein
LASLIDRPKPPEVIGARVVHPNDRDPPGRIEALKTSPQPARQPGVGRAADAGANSIGDSHRTPAAAPTRASSSSAKRPERAGTAKQGPAAPVHPGAAPLTVTTRKRIVEILREAGGHALTSAILAKCTDINQSSARVQLTRMAKEGLLKTIALGNYREGNIWCLPEVTLTASQIATTRMAQLTKRKHPWRAPKSAARSPEQPAQADDHTASFAVSDDGCLGIRLGELRLSLDQQNFALLREFIAVSRPIWRAQAAGATTEHKEA